MKRPRQPKVAILGARYGDLAVEERMLKPLGVKIVEGRGQSEADIVAVARGAQIILCGGAPKITTAVIRQLPGLKAVVRYGIGVDTVAIPECTRQGIYVANVPDYCIEEVATHALTLVLASIRKLPIAQGCIRRGQWEIAPVRPLQSPQDLVLGLLGFGRIAQSLCRMARAVGFQVSARDPYVQKRSILRNGAEPVTMTRLFRTADVISLHLPLTPLTRHIINVKRLKIMKPTAFLVNTARGELVDEKALHRALVKGWIAGAALDVLEKEPPGRNHPLRSMENVILTPHGAWYTERSQKQLREKACAEVMQVLRGDVPKNIVNRGVLE